MVATIDDRTIHRVCRCAAIPFGIVVTNPQSTLVAERISRFLSSGNFYYSKTPTTAHTKGHDAALPCHSFVWNSFMMKPFREYFDVQPSYTVAADDILLTLFYGFTGQYMISSRIRCVIISRVSKCRAGTRYLSRGLDDDGHVSSFIESKIIIIADDLASSFSIIRGSVPVFWDQQGFQLGYPRVQLTRSPIASQPAFDLHFENLKASYGLVHILDLLSQKEGHAEATLSRAYEYHVRRYGDLASISYSRVDLYSVERSVSDVGLIDLLNGLAKDIQSFGYFQTRNGATVRQQRGIFRVNCFDCVDRTNYIQLQLVIKWVDLLYRSTPDIQALCAYEEIVLSITDLWSDNGDLISRLYTGSNALRSNFGRLGKPSVRNLLDDLNSTAWRFYADATENNRTQRIIDFTLGKQDGQVQMPLFTLDGLNSFSTLTVTGKRELNIHAVTWNINNHLPMEGTDYGLLLSGKRGVMQPDIYVIGFQEIVELKASQIISADPERRVLWEGIIIKILNDKYPRCQYSLLSSHQVVGTTLSIFARSDLISTLKRVEFASIKTGLGGMAGNKGSVAIRFEYCDTQICFVNSHFQAGQYSLLERNSNMSQANRELQFSQNKTIDSHENIVWMGDLNYRVEMSRIQALELIYQKKIKSLRQFDQLTNEIARLQVFKGYKEAEIMFAPTYKYDPGTNIYDSRYFFYQNS